MEKRDPLPLGANAGLLVYEPDAQGTTALENRIQISNGKADVMDGRSALRHEPADWRAGIRRFEKLHERFPRLKRLYPGAIGITHVHRLQSQNLAVEWNRLIESRESDSNMRDSSGLGG